MQLTNLVRTISLIGACAFVALSSTLRAVLPAPDGGYPGDNTAEGQDALLNLVVGSTTGIYNTAVGFDALFKNTDGVSNTAIGLTALQNNTTGNNNTGTGVDALQGNTTGSFNTATGVEALYSNTTGSNNTANGGFQTLFSNTTGSNNTATGSFALFNNTTADNNTAFGFQALLSNTTGGTETAIGFNSLSSNTTGEDNTAIGFSALSNNIIGFGNTAVGVLALFGTTAANNTADGCFALQNDTTGFTNTAVGQAALINNTTGAQNIALGAGAGSNLTTGNNNIDIGNFGVAGESAKIRIGTKPTQKATFIAGISGVTVASGVGVIINTQGQLGTVVSSERFKDEIKPMDKASEAILTLKPVTFRYKHDLDPDGIPQFGLVAEQVEKVDPNLVARDDNGKPYTVRYEAVNAMLLNEFLKEHRTVQELTSIVARQEATIVRQEKDFQSTSAQQRKEIKVLAASLKEQASQIAKVSAQVEAKKPSPQMVAENQ